MKRGNGLAIGVWLVGMPIGLVMFLLLLALYNNIDILERITNTFTSLP